MQDDPCDRWPFSCVHSAACPSESHNTLLTFHRLLALTWVSVYILHYLRVDWSIIERAPIWVCIVLLILCCDMMQFSQHTVLFSVLVILAETFNLIFHTQPLKQVLTISTKMLKKILYWLNISFLRLPHFIIQTISSSFTDNHDGNVYKILISSYLLVLFSRLEPGVNVVCNL